MRNRANNHFFSTSTPCIGSSWLRRASFLGRRRQDGPRHCRRCRPASKEQCSPFDSRFFWIFKKEFSPRREQVEEVVEPQQGEQGWGGDPCGYLLFFPPFRFACCSTKRSLECAYLRLGKVVFARFTKSKIQQCYCVLTSFKGCLLATEQRST